MSKKNVALAAVAILLSVLTAPLALAVDNGSNPGDSLNVAATAQATAVTSDAAAPSFSDLLLNFLSNLVNPPPKPNEGGLGLAPQPQERGPSVEPNKV